MKKILLFLVLSLGIMFSCNNSEKRQEAKQVSLNKDNKLSGEVLEVKDVDKYTYVKIKNSEGKEIWVAGPKTAVKKGEKLNISSGMLMKDFNSKTLNKTFKEIYFVGSLKGKKGGFHSMHGSFHGGNKVNDRLKEELNAEYNIKKIEKLKDGYSIEEIYGKLNELNGKKVKIKGQVVKFSKDIMDRNWVHLRDGSGKTYNNDLTVTTKDVVKEGDIVIFEGVLAVDKDFGYGYKYKAIIENASLK